jgi:phosphotransferase system HPr-like phosphotransfer protein
MIRKEVDLIPAELRAIEVHKYYLSQQEGREVSLEEAIAGFFSDYEAEFRRKKCAQDTGEEVEEILRFKWIESEKEGHDIGEEKAAQEWIGRYGSIWRDTRESLEKNGFLQLNVAIKDGKEARIDMAALAGIARHYDCDVYIHQDGMKYYNFELFGKKEYLNVKSMLCPGYLDAARGEDIQVISSGTRAKEAIEEIDRFFHNTSSSTEKRGREDGSDPSRIHEQSR